jgi:prevent-host-death family protein
LHATLRVKVRPITRVVTRSPACNALTIAQRELRNDNAKVIEAVLAGDSFLITRNGVPVAELRPVTAGRRRMIRGHEVRDVAAKGSRIDAAGFHADLDHALDQEL